MTNKRNVAVVLFNPPLNCIEQILEFISVFKHTHSELHVLSDLEQPEGLTKEKDLLVLELSLPKKISQLLLKYVSQLYPAVNVFIINNPKASNSEGMFTKNTTDFKDKPSLSEYNFDLN